MLSYDEINDAIYSKDVKEIEAEIGISDVESTESVKGKIKMAHNLGYARGYRAAMRKYAIKNTDVKDVLGYEQNTK